MHPCRGGARRGLGLHGAGPRLAPRIGGEPGGVGLPARLLLRVGLLRWPTRRVKIPSILRIGNTVRIPPTPPTTTTTTQKQMRFAGNIRCIYPPSIRTPPIRPTASARASDRSVGHRAGRMGIFTLGKSSPVATEVPRRAYINQPAHPSHKSFCDNSMVRQGPLLAPHTWVASCVPHIARRSASGRQSKWLLPRPRPHNRDVHLTLTPETTSAAAAENGKVRLPLGPMGARGAGAVPQLLPQVHHHLRPHQDALPLLPSHLCSAGPHTAALLLTGSHAFL